MRAGGACCWANVCTKKPSALATSEVTISADQTVPPSGALELAGQRRAIASGTTPHTPSCTASSAPTS